METTWKGETTFLVRNYDITISSGIWTDVIKKLNL